MAQTRHHVVCIQDVGMLVRQVKNQRGRTKQDVLHCDSEEGKAGEYISLLPLFWGMCLWAICKTKFSSFPVL